MVNVKSEKNYTLKEIADESDAATRMIHHDGLSLTDHISDHPDLLYSLDNNEGRELFGAEWWDAFTRLQVDGYDAFSEREVNRIDEAKDGLSYIFAQQAGAIHIADSFEELRSKIIPFLAKRLQEYITGIEEINEADAKKHYDSVRTWVRDHLQD